MVAPTGRGGTEGERNSGDGNPRVKQGGGRPLQMRWRQIESDEMCDLHRRCSFCCNLRWEDDTTVKERKCVGDARRLSRITPAGNTDGYIHNRGVVRDTLLANWVGEGKDWVRELKNNPPGGGFAKGGGSTDGPSGEEITGDPSKRPRELGPTAFGKPREGEEAWEEQERGRMGERERPGEEQQGRGRTNAKKLRKWGAVINMVRREGDWATHFFREHNELGDEWAVSGEPKSDPHEGSPQWIVFRHLNDKKTNVFHDAHIGNFVLRQYFQNCRFGHHRH